MTKPLSMAANVHFCSSSRPCSQSRPLKLGRAATLQERYQLKLQLGGSQRKPILFSRNGIAADVRTCQSGSVSARQSLSNQMLGLSLKTKIQANGFLIKSRRRSWMSARAGISIDRKLHMDEAFKRQQEEELREAEAEVTCPLDCVREVRTCSEFERMLAEAERTNELVVLDFYNSACGSCKYIGRQLVKICKSELCTLEGAYSGIIFAKHNVRDDYDELTDLAQLYEIKVVPMFAFFANGSRIEQFPTRDRKRLEETLIRLMAGGAEPELTD